MHHRALCSSSSRLGTHDETCAEEVLVKPWSSTWRHENSGECKHHQIQTFKNKHLEMISQCGVFQLENITGRGDQAHGPSGAAGAVSTELLRRPYPPKKKLKSLENNDIKSQKTSHAVWNRLWLTHTNINTHTQAHRRKEGEHLLFNGILKLACHHCLPKVFTLATMFRMWSVETFS